MTKAMRQAQIVKTRPVTGQANGGCGYDQARFGYGNIGSQGMQAGGMETQVETEDGVAGGKEISQDKEIPEPSNDTFTSARNR